MISNLFLPETSVPDFFVSPFTGNPFRQSKKQMATQITGNQDIPVKSTPQQFYPRSPSGVPAGLPLLS